MNKNITKKISLFVALALVLSVSSLASPVKAVTFASIGSQLGVGSTGSNVTNLQTFLASDRNIYPEGRVTGYYGTLTSKAVAQFQLSYGIPPVGRVGPMTLQKVNDVIATGNGIDIYGPTIYNVSVQKSGTTATFSWSTSEFARGKVYYSTTPFSFVEASGSFSEPVIIGGSNALAVNIMPSQAVTLQNLQTNTLYYYIIQASDASGNVSVTVQSSFVTNQ